MELLPPFSHLAGWGEDVACWCCTCYQVVFQAWHLPHHLSDILPHPPPSLQPLLGVRALHGLLPALLPPPPHQMVYHSLGPEWGQGSNGWAQSQGVSSQRCSSSSSSQEHQSSRQGSIYVDTSRQLAPEQPDQLCTSWGPSCLQISSLLPNFKHLASEQPDLLCLFRIKFCWPLPPPPHACICLL